MEPSFKTRGMTVLLLATALPAQGWATDWKPQVERLVAPAVESGVVVGMAIGVIANGQTQTFGFGKASAASPQPPDETTLFEIGSVTKVFTALALADMARQGLLSLDDPVGKWLPPRVQVPSRDGKEITLAHLATHASGLPRLGRILEAQAIRNPLNPYVEFSIDDLYATLGSARLASVPGMKYAYSNLGVGLLGHVLARRAETSYEELIQRRICQPLGMRQTRVTLPDAWKSRLAEGHDIDGNPLPPWDIVTLAGCGGLRSNVRDLVRFVQANLGLLSSPLDDAIQTTHQPRLDFNPNEAICLGWHLKKAEGILWHNGQTGGYHSFVGLRESPPLGVVVLGNSAGGTVDAIGYRLLELLDGKEPKPLPIRVPARVDPAILEHYVGNYELYPNFILTVTRTGDRLWVQATGQPRLGIYPESETTFFYRAVDARITFVRNQDGKVDKLILHQHGFALPAFKGGWLVHFGGQLWSGIKGLGRSSVQPSPPSPAAPK
mgnify:CR=1 FL=1